LFDAVQIHLLQHVHSSLFPQFLWLNIFWHFEE